MLRPAERELLENALRTISSYRRSSELLEHALRDRISMDDELDEVLAFVITLRSESSLLEARLRAICEPRTVELRPRKLVVISGGMVDG